MPDARFDGGTGLDILAFEGSDFSPSVSSVASQSALNTNNSSRLGSLELFDLTGSGSNSLSLTDPEQRHQLVITGNSGDALSVSDGTWTNAGTASFSGAFSGLSGSYNVWNLGFHQLLVHSSLSTSGLP